jgi:AbrB family looped-hinge helix DNA binding protein
LDEEDGGLRCRRRPVEVEHLIGTAVLDVGDVFQNVSAGGGANEDGKEIATKTRGVLQFPDRSPVAGGNMARTRVSPKFQVVIPKEVRESIDLRVGQEMQVVAKGGVITLVPERPLSSLRGFAKGIRTDKLREKKDRM